MSVDGTVMVLLPPEQYASLAAARRLAGAQASQIHGFKLALGRMDALLAEAALLLEAQPQAPEADPAPAETRQDLLARIVAERLRAPRRRSRRPEDLAKPEDQTKSEDQTGPEDQLRTGGSPSAPLEREQGRDA
jgi:hypothetical protein